MAKIDIIVPCHNYGRFLEACVRSALDQSVSDIRVLIIDDASSDDSLQVANRLAKADGRISVIAHPRNWGHIQTYNQGIAWASADYFLLLSADDMLVPGALSRAVTVMDAAPDIVLTHGQCVVWRDEFPLPRIEPQPTNDWSREDLILVMCASGGNCVHTPTAIVRTSVQKAVGEYRTSLPHSGDMEMWLRFAAKGAAARIGAVQAIYRKHTRNMSIPYYNGDLADLQQCKQAFDSFFGQHVDQITGGRRLQEQADRMLARKAFWTGIIRVCRGHFAAGRLVLRFAFDLDPTLRYRPPWSGLPFALREMFKRLLSRVRRAVLAPRPGARM